MLCGRIFMDEQTYQGISVIQIIVTKFAILFSHHLTLPPPYSSLFYFPTGADSQLKPVTVDFHHEENRTAHKTDDYEIPQLIVRRGKEFDFTVTFNRDYHPEVDVIVVQFVTGKAFSMYILACV